MPDSQNATPEQQRKRLTEQQQQALATDKNISVTAGAGSGKTTILVERYLKIILEEKVDVRKVLAITFTEKAAAEMTERVARMIRERLATTGDDRERERLLELRERLNSAQISTIHAFCSKILREFAVASGIDPDFNVLNEFQHDLLLNESVDEVLTRLDLRDLESEFSFEDWKELLRQVPPNTLRQILFTGLQHSYEISQLRENYQKYDNNHLLEDLQTLFFTRLENDVNTAAIARAILPEMQTVMDASVERSALKTNGHEAFSLIEQLLAIAWTDAETPRYWQLLMDLSQKLVTTKGEPFNQRIGFAAKKVLGDAFAPIKQLSEILHPLYLFTKNYSSAVPGDNDLLCFQAVRKILFLLEAVENIYREKKEERGLLDFDDLQLLALEMLRDHAPVRNELRNRYRYIMVDEFQDTNHLQWALISLLGVYDGKLQPDKFFVVGDPKQSIYGFRNADVRVFQEVKESFARQASTDASKSDSYDGNIVLQESFRFLPDVNRFVNFLFAQILGSDDQNAFDVPYDHLMTRREVTARSYIEVTLLDNETQKVSGLTQEDYVAQTIRALLNGTARPGQMEVLQRQGDGEVPRKVQPGDIAILIPRRTHLLTLESRLRQYGIPFKTIGGVGFYRRQEIYDVYHLLRLLDNPSDDIALVGILRSPLAGVSDAALFHLAQAPVFKDLSYRERLQKLHESGDYSMFPPADSDQLKRFVEQLIRWELRRDRLSLSRLLSEIFEESFYRATIAAEWNGEQLLANLDKIIEMARDYEQGGFMALSDFIEMLHRTIQLDPREGEAQTALEDEGTVKIMTIHQAKGLEFPIVFCPYLQQAPRIDTRKIRFDVDLGLAMKIRSPQEGYREVKPFLYELINFRQKQREIAELKRLFYVAATRSRDHLYLIGSYRSHELKGENCLGWTVRALGIDAEDLSSETMTVDGDLQVHICRTADTENIPQVAELEIAPELKELKDAIDTSDATSSDFNEIDGQYAYLRPATDAPKGVTFSATQLLTFKADPHAYFQRYHLGFFESDYEFLKQAMDSDTLSLLKGKIVHQILEDGVPEDDAEMAEQLALAYFQYEVFDREEQEKLNAEIPELLFPFAQSEFARKIFSPAEWKIEISLTMRLGEDYFTGTLDRIFCNPDGTWEVADYKTNNVRAGEVETAGEKYLMQMQSYAMLMAELFPEQENFPVTLYFLKPQKEFTRVYSQDDVRETREDFLALIRQIKEYYPFSDRLDMK